MGNRTAENTYDPSNALRRTHTRVFNTLNQLWKDVNAAGTAAVTTTFGYDNNGNQTTINAPLSRNSTSLYDELNRLKQITDPASGVTQFGYDANDNLTSVTDPRSLVTSYTYNGFGDLKTQTQPGHRHSPPTPTTPAATSTPPPMRAAPSPTYAYDALNRVTSASFTLGGVTDQTITYTYDTGTNQKGRLTGASRCQPLARLDLRRAGPRDRQGPDAWAASRSSLAMATTPPASSRAPCCPPATRSRTATTPTAR